MTGDDRGPTARLTHLLDRYVDEAATAEEKAELEQVLLSSPAARRAFWDHTRFHALLRRLGEESWGAQLASAAPRRIRPSFFRRFMASRGAVLGAGLALAAATWALVPRRPPGDETFGAKEGASSGLAVLARALDVDWGVGGRPRRNGEVLSPGVLKFARGLVQIDFYSGAKVILQGPAEMLLVSADEVVCRRGRLHGHVPAPARGFRVRSSEIDVVDLGTSFGMNVPDRGPAEVHVFDGKVEVHPASRRAAAKQMQGGASAAFARGRPARAIASAPEAFPAIADLDRIEAESDRIRLSRWQAAAQRLREPGGPLVHFTFQPDTLAQRAVANLGSLKDTVGHGTVVGGRPAAGRWPGKGALELRRASDRVRLAIPGEYESLTMLVWARVDSLPNAFHGLLMTDEFPLAHPHWQIRASGQISFSYRHPELKGYVQTVTKAVIVPEMFGQWIQIAVVFDGQSKTVTQYLNGKTISDHAVEHVLPLRLDTSEIGNWGLTRLSSSPIRNLVGGIDEFLLFGRALTAQEIGQIFAEGDPYSPFERPRQEPDRPARDQGPETR